MWILYVNPVTFAAARKSEPLPFGSQIVMKDHAVRLGPGGVPLVDQQGRNGEWEYACRQSGVP